MTSRCQLQYFKLLNTGGNDGQSHIICYLQSSVFLGVNVAWTHISLKERVPVTSPTLPVTLKCLSVTVLRPWASVISVCWELPVLPMPGSVTLAVGCLASFLGGVFLVFWGVFCLFCLGGQKLKKSTWVLCSEPCLVWFRSRASSALGGRMGHSASCRFRFFKGSNRSLKVLYSILSCLRPRAWVMWAEVLRYTQRICNPRKLQPHSFQDWTEELLLQLILLRF